MLVWIQNNGSQNGTKHKQPKKQTCSGTCSHPIKYRSAQPVILMALTKISAEHKSRCEASHPNIASNFLEWSEVTERLNDLFLETLKMFFNHCFINVRLCYTTTLWAFCFCLHSNALTLSMAIVQLVSGDETCTKTQKTIEDSSMLHRQITCFNLSKPLKSSHPSLNPPPAVPDNEPSRSAKIA